MKASPLSYYVLILALFLVDLVPSSFVLGVPARPGPDAIPYAGEKTALQLDSGSAQRIFWQPNLALNSKDGVKEDAVFDGAVVDPLFAHYKLRLHQANNLCDPSVKQYSGYLDIANDKHLFFWFFESRVASSSTAPVILWLNGGPGCSSSTGLFIELGPCTVIDGGNSTAPNPHSWNAHANIIFLDQPVDVGYSYSDKGSKSKRVTDSKMAAKDVYAFLQLFFARFKGYAKLPFHVAAESYGTIYATHLAKEILERNQGLSSTRRRLGLGVQSERSLGTSTPPTLINLASVILANGITDPYSQYPSIADYVCEGPYSDVFGGIDSPECGYVKSKAPVCQRLIEECYKAPTKKNCVQAHEYCSSEIEGPLLESGINPYDVRRQCNAKDNGDACYKEMGWLEKFLNVPEHKLAIGVNPNHNFTACDLGVFDAFTKSGEPAKNTASLLPELVDAGIRLLVYAGDADPICNVIGNERWLERLETNFRDEFLASPRQLWKTLNTGRVAGVVRSAGGSGFTAGNVTFANVYNAGHLVPYDQPEAALDLISRWIANVPLTRTGG